MLTRPSGSLVANRLPGQLTLEAGALALASAIRADLTLQTRDGIVRRYEVGVREVDPLVWLAAQTRGERVFFKNREGSLMIAGAGKCFSSARLSDHAVASCLSSESHDFPETGQPSEPLFFVVNWFDPTTVRREPSRWLGFSPVRVVLPRVEIRRTRETILAVHVCDDEALALDALSRLAPASMIPAVPHGFQMTADGDPSRWVDSIDAALEAIEHGSYDKVVLARTRQYGALEPIDPCGVLAALRAEEPAAFHILIEQSPSRAFVGASPERLYKRKGALVHSEAVAGTCTRGPDGVSDERLAARLLCSEKNLREHDFVVRRIEAALSPLMVTLTREASPRIMRLRHVQHLLTGIIGHLRDGACDQTILDALHPTPAVCGWPLAASREFIRDHEPFARGLYAGVVGVVSASRSDFTVAIRSAVIDGATLTAFAGAGVVRGSEADAEWLETARKLESFEGIARRAAQGPLTQPYRRLIGRGPGFALRTPKITVASL
ncbi:MAG: isochorismate synthase [Phycisphaerales bacterium]|nr:isochorismate synthase [Phycisphaerales bacterium]